MNQQQPTKAQAVVGGGVGVLGGSILWINSHLGTAFYALMLLVFLNFVVAMWEKDPIQLLVKMTKVIVGVSIPFVVPILAETQKLGWSTNNTKTLVGLMFAALLSASVPNLLAFLKNVMSAMKIQKVDQAVILAEAQAEIARLKAQALSNPVPYNPQPIKTVTSVTPPNQGGNS